MSAGPDFYRVSARNAAYTCEDVLAGRVIRLSPALITIIDGRIGSESPEDLRRDVLARAAELLDYGAVRSLHVDINFEDYSGFGDRGPDRNAAVFTPDFVEELNAVAQTYEAFVTLHLLTDFPARHLRDFEHIPLGAVCFQLDAVMESDRLAALVEQIGAMGACASPVIETVGTDQRAPLPEADVRERLAPLLSQIGMLTFQAAGTAARSNLPAGAFARDPVAAAITTLKAGFSGTIQLQGGIKTGTVGAAVAVGADFVVAGTQLFRNRDGLTPAQVVDAMLAAAADVLGV
jgi:pentose-5-phosphate-3-epimerase